MVSMWRRRPTSTRSITRPDYFQLFLLWLWPPPSLSSSSFPLRQCCYVFCRELSSLWRQLRLGEPLTGRGSSYHLVRLSAGSVWCQCRTKINLVMSGVTSIWLREKKNDKDEVTAALYRLEGGEQERQHTFQWTLYWCLNETLHLCNVMCLRNVSSYYSFILQPCLRLPWPHCLKDLPLILEDESCIM